MKIVFLHGLGQTAQDWQIVAEHTQLSDVDCPGLFSLANGNFTYSNILSEFEKLYEKTEEPFMICGLSLGAILALDYTIRHPKEVSSLVLIGAQYKVPTLLIDFQNLIFRFMPRKVLLPHSKLHIIPGAGHEINQSAPEAISTIINNLIIAY